MCDHSIPFYCIVSYCILSHYIQLPGPRYHLVDSPLTLSSAGIECPRSSRNTASGMQVAEPFSDEAMMLTKELVLQREVSHLL